jgi:hypothetical protein
MPYIGLSEAAKLTGKDKATIHRAMVSGRLFFIVGPDGARQIDPAELERVFRIKEPAAIAPRTRIATGRNHLQSVQTDALLEAERGKVTILEATVADLRNRLDRAEAERRQAQEKLTALLADQRVTPPSASIRRRWWPSWGRR